MLLVLADIDNSFYREPGSSRMKKNPHITGLILAGGQARRMGGIDKGLIQLRGRAMIEYIIDALLPQVSSLLINANRNLDAYQALGFEVLSDDIDGFQGPLAGMAAGLKHCQSGYIATAPCDGPLLPSDYVKTLHCAAQQAGSKISVGFDGKRLQPVYALIHAGLLPDLLAYLAAGERKIDGWYHNHGYAQADFSFCPQMFTNINTRADLQAASQLV